MLREALEWLVTPSLPFTRRTGHLSEFVAIAARRRRHRAAWAPHEARSRAAVLRAAATADPDGVAVILGAGHLYDVPLSDLAARFRSVRLVDLAFSAATRRAARRLGNVACVSHDVTESLPALTAVATPRFLLEEPGLKFVASVNLLSQLAVVATRELDDTTADRVGRSLIEAHLAWLRCLPCPAALICDRSVEILGPDGAVAATLDPFRGADPPGVDEAWTWNIAPAGEVDRTHSVRHIVGATDWI